MQRLLPLIAQSSVARLLHTSSIDVYGSAPERWLDESTVPQPATAYEREHRKLEQLVARSSLESCVVRPGAVFGPGGRNLVSLATEVGEGRRWRLAARRALNGRRRMHLVSVANVADALIWLTTLDHVYPRAINVCDDVDEENNYEYVQQALLRAFDCRDLPAIPLLPPAMLRLVLAVRGGGGNRPDRRFSQELLTRLGFLPERSFSSRLTDYADHLAQGWK